MDPKMCFHFLYKFSRKVSHSKKSCSNILSLVQICIHVKYPLVSSYFKDTMIFSKDFQNSLNTKFHEDTSSGNRFVPCGQTDVLTGRYYEYIKRFSQFCGRD